jgi:UDP-N-acetylmuramate--alanine ligase
MRLRVPGRVAVLNSLAAASVGRELGLGVPEIAAGLEAFSGVERRFQVKADAGGILVVDDYGHHPTEIRATLQTAKEAFGRRTVVVFQPHRYSRVRDLFEEFCRAFHQADVLLVTDIYAAGEDPLPEVTGRALAEGIERHGHRQVRFVEDLDEALSMLSAELQEGDLALTLGAGTVTGLSDRLGEVLVERAR